MIPFNFAFSEQVTKSHQLSIHPLSPPSFPFLLIFNTRVFLNFIVQIQEFIHGLCQADFPDANVNTNEYITKLVI